MRWQLKPKVSQLLPGGLWEQALQALQGTEGLCCTVLFICLQPFKNVKTSLSSWGTPLPHPENGFGLWATACPHPHASKYNRMWCISTFFIPVKLPPQQSYPVSSISSQQHSIGPQRGEERRGGSAWYDLQSRPHLGVMLLLRGSSCLDFHNFKCRGKLINHDLVTSVTSQLSFMS